MPCYRECKLAFLGQGKSIVGVRISLCVVVKGQKLLIEKAKVRTYDAPKWPELATDKVMKFFQFDGEVLKHLPDLKAKEKMPREFMWQVIFTLRQDYTLHLVAEARK